MTTTFPQTETEPVTCFYCGTEYWRDLDPVCPLCRHKSQPKPTPAPAKIQVRKSGFPTGSKTSPRRVLVRGWALKSLSI